MTRLKFFLIDQDRYRTGAITDALLRLHGVTVADNLSEFSDGRPGYGIVLVADEPGIVAQTVGRLKKAGIPAKVMVYTEYPSPHGMVQAMAAGAADYLHWPCDGANIVAAANAAIAAALG